MRGCLLFLEWGLLRLLFWLEVRFPVRAEYGLRAVVCCCNSLDREEGHNWYLFSQRDILLDPVSGRRKEAARYSLKSYHFSFAGIRFWRGIICGAVIRVYRWVKGHFREFLTSDSSAHFSFTAKWWISVHFFVIIINKRMPKDILTVQ